MKWATTFAVEKLWGDRRCRHDFVESDVQSRQAAQAKIVTPNNLCVRRQGQIGRAASERLKGKLAFDARQGGAKTKVTGPAKREMRIIGASQIERVRICESLGIAIARSHDRNHRLPFPDELAADYRVFRTNAGGLLARTLVTQQLFDS